VDVIGKGTFNVTPSHGFFQDNSVSGIGWFHNQAPLASYLDLTDYEPSPGNTNLNFDIETLVMLNSTSPSDSFGLVGYPDRIESQDTLNRTIESLVRTGNLATSYIGAPFSVSTEGFDLLASEPGFNDAMRNYITKNNVATATCDGEFETCWPELSESVVGTVTRQDITFRFSPELRTAISTFSLLRPNQLNMEEVVSRSDMELLSLVDSRPRGLSPSIRMSLFCESSPDSGSQLYPFSFGERAPEECRWHISRNDPEDRGQYEHYLSTGDSYHSLIAEYWDKDPYVEQARRSGQFDEIATFGRLHVKASDPRSDEFPVMRTKVPVIADVREGAEPCQGIGERDFLESEPDNYHDPFFDDQAEYRVIGYVIVDLYDQSFTVPPNDNVAPFDANFSNNRDRPSIKQDKDSKTERETNNDSYGPMPWYFENESFKPTPLNMVRGRITCESKFIPSSRNLDIPLARPVQ
jgi:hypothetical protein